MNQKEIQDLIKYVAKSGVTEIVIEKKDFKITIKTGAKSGFGEDGGQGMLFQPPIPQFSQPMPIPQPVPTQPVSAAPTPQATEVKTEPIPTENKYITIKSPMIGTFYRASAPDKPVFVEVGDDIKKGDTVCIIEAMKLFNEIESEVQGKIVKVLVDDATPVEYDQPLYLVDPS